MPRKGVELTESAKKKLPAAKAARAAGNLGTGAAARAAQGAQKANRDRKSKIDEAMSAFKRATKQK